MCLFDSNHFWGMTKVISHSFSYIALLSLLGGSLWPKACISPVCFDIQHPSEVFSLFLSQVRSVMDMG